MKVPPLIEHLATTLPKDNNLGSVVATKHSAKPVVIVKYPMYYSECEIIKIKTELTDKMKMYKLIFFPSNRVNITEFNPLNGCLSFSF